jgi:AcrR family transcriptional regulator
MATQDLRTRKRLAVMRRVQDAAIELFERHGFATVTVEQVARAAEVGVASVFRNFGTKEALVLWDEYDPALFDAIARRLGERRRPLDAARAALVEQVGAVYARDKKRILRRTELTMKTPALAAAARLNVHELRSGFEKLLEPHVRERLQRELLAAVLASTLEVTVEEWRRLRARVPLATLLVRAFKRLEDL